MASRADRTEPWWWSFLGFTTHARARMQQRSVPEWVVAVVITHGELRHVGDGDVSYSFSTRAWRQIGDREPELVRRLERWRNVYVVLTAEGDVKTVARRRSCPGHARRRHERP
ncbi:MAG: hypothetical protein ACK4MX_06275 [Thermaurantiacus sp.]